MVVTPACKESIKSLLIPLVIRLLVLRKRLSKSMEPPCLSVTADHLRLVQTDIEWSAIPDCFRDKQLPSTLSSILPLPSVSFIEQTTSQVEPSPVLKIAPEESLVPIEPEQCARAVTVISKFFRMYRTRKWYKTWRLDELLFLGAIRESPPITRALLSNQEKVISFDEADEFFRSETRKQLATFREEKERQLEISFVQPVLLNIWKFFEINGEFPKDVSELIKCTDKGDLKRPPVFDPPKSKPTAAGTKKKEKTVKQVEEARDLSLESLCDTVKKYNFKVGKNEMNENEIIESIKQKFIKEIIQPELESASGKKHSPVNNDEDNSIEKLNDIRIDVETVFLRDMCRDRDVVEASFCERSMSRTSLCAKLVEEIVLPLSSNHVYSQCGLEYRSVLLYGPRGCGKETIARMIVTESGALVMSFELLMKQSKEIIGTSIDRLKTVCQKNVPVIVLVGELGNLVQVSSSKGALSAKKNNLNNKNAKPHEILERIREELKGTRSLIIGFCSDPGFDMSIFAPQFERKFMVNRLNENEMLEFILGVLKSNGVDIGKLTFSERERLVAWARKTERISNASLLDLFAAKTWDEVLNTKIEKITMAEWANFASSH